LLGPMFDVKHRDERLRLRMHWRCQGDSIPA
jgi:hypothetical protein